MPGPCVTPLEAGGAGEAIPSVGMLPANTVPESAQVRASAITNRFKERRQLLNPVPIGAIPETIPVHAR